MRGEHEVYMRKRRMHNLNTRRAILERELADVDRELESLEEKYVQVIFLLGPDSPEWAWDDSFRDKLYTYTDPSGKLRVGDIVRAGMLNGIAQVVALGKGETPSYKEIEQVGSLVHWTNL